jgi:hypothetical protein
VTTPDTEDDFTELVDSKPNRAIARKATELLGDVAPPKALRGHPGRGRELPV